MHNFIGSLLFGTTLTLTASAGSLDSLILENPDLVNNSSKREAVATIVEDECENLAQKKLGSITFVDKKHMGSNAGIQISEKHIYVASNVDVYPTILTMAHELGHAVRNFEHPFCSKSYEFFKASNDVEKNALCDLIHTSSMLPYRFLDEFKQSSIAQSSLNELFAIMYSKAVMSNAVDEPANLVQCILDHFDPERRGNYLHKYMGPELMGIMLSLEFSGDLVKTVRYLQHTETDTLINKFLSIDSSDALPHLELSLGKIAKRYGCLGSLDGALAKLKENGDLVAKSISTTQSKLARFMISGEVELSFNDQERKMAKNYFSELIKIKQKSAETRNPYELAQINYKLSRRASELKDEMVGSLITAAKEDSVNFLVQAYLLDDQFAEENSKYVFSHLSQNHKLFYMPDTQARLYAIRLDCLNNMGANYDESLSKFQDEINDSCQMICNNPSKIVEHVLLDDKIHTLTELDVSLLKDIRNHELFISKNMVDFDMDACREYLQLVNCVVPRDLAHYFKSDTYFLMGLAHDQSGDYDGAQEYYEYFRELKQNKFLSVSLNLNYHRWLQTNDIWNRINPETFAYIRLRP